MAELTRDCLELPPSQRLKLARILLDVSDPDPGFSPDAEVAWEDEILARIEAVRTGAAQSRPVEEVFAELDRRFPA